MPARIQLVIPSVDPLLIVSGALDAELNFDLENYDLTYDRAMAEMGLGESEVLKLCEFVSGNPFGFLFLHGQMTHVQLQIILCRTVLQLCDMFAEAVPEVEGDQSIHDMRDAMALCLKFWSGKIGYKAWTDKIWDIKSRISERPFRYVLEKVKGSDPEADFLVKYVSYCDSKLADITNQLILWVAASANESPARFENHSEFSNTRRRIVTTVQLLTAFRVKDALREGFVKHAGKSSMRTLTQMILRASGASITLRDEDIARLAGIMVETAGDLQHEPGKNRMNPIAIVTQWLEH